MKCVISNPRGEAVREVNLLDTMQLQAGLPAVPGGAGLSGGRQPWLHGQSGPPGTAPRAEVVCLKEHLENGGEKVDLPAALGGQPQARGYKDLCLQAAIPLTSRRGSAHSGSGYGSLACCIF